MKHAFAAALILCATALAQPATTVSIREPKYAPKTARTLHSDAEIARARENIKTYPAAAELAEGVISAADRWVDWEDEDLRFLLTSHEVPRAFAVSASGCPVCGDKMKASQGDYGWIIDSKKPFKIKCPVDGTVFPSNDYETYYRSCFKDRKGFDTQYADDGWGWTDPKTGEKFWFVAYYNHWMWHKHLVLGLQKLGQAYLLTGDEKYARKAAVMLRRIAEVYPGMDHAKQSRYGRLSAVRGIDYGGKVVNRIWETSLTQYVADAYDAVFDSIAPESRKFIEANFLEDAIDAYFQGKIRGNFGMHQATLVHLAQVRQTGETDKWFDMLLDESSNNYPTLGLNFALYNLISRDGFPSESAPGYNNIWVNEIAEYGELLQRAGRDVFSNPRIKRLFDAVIDQINAGQFTPAIGDSGGFYGGIIGANAGTYLTAYRHFKDPRYLAFIAKTTGGDINFKSFDSLFAEPVDLPKEAKLPPANPRLLDGFGLAILNNPADKISLSLYYGQRHGHGHFDRLNFELFANGQPIMPDLGYPDAMNDYVPGIYTWSKNTIAHNTVVVNAKRQTGNVPGEVKLFADSPFARVIDVEAKDSYPQCFTYRRAMIMVDAGENQSYFVDIFTAGGGDQHDYSLHGPPGDFEMIGGDWSEPAKGTLAGENVALGEIYDDPTLAAKDHRTGYGSYEGSGFQHLFNVRMLRDRKPWIAQWKHERDPSTMLRIRILGQPDQKVMLADAHASPARHKQIIKYLIARRRGGNLASRFVSVIEPFKDKPVIKDIEFVPLESGEGVVLKVTRDDGSNDLIAYDPTESLKRFEGLFTFAHVLVTLRDAQQQPLHTFNSTSSHIDVLRGDVTATLPFKGGVVVSLKSPVDVAPESLIGQVVHFKNAFHRTAHMIASVKPEGASHYILTFADDIHVGLAKIDTIEPQAITTSTALPLAPSYRGTTLSDELFRLSVPVKSVSDGRIELDQPLPADHNLKVGEKIWLLNVGVGDTIEIPLIRFTKEAKDDHRK